jgi:hypothetical protein
MDQIVVVSRISISLRRDEVISWDVSTTNPFPQKAGRTSRHNQL